jgi:hypothetical protein
MAAFDKLEKCPFFTDKPERMPAASGLRQRRDRLRMDASRISQYSYH